MPIYTYVNKKTKKVSKKKLGIQTISEMEAYLEANPHLELGVTGAPGFGDMWRLGMKKPSDAFRDRLKDIKKKHRGSVINTW